MSRTYEEELKLITAEKSKVKAASSATVNSRSNWQPIATEWFEKWKLYVDFSDNFDLSQRTPEVSTYLIDSYMLTYNSIFS
jgi:hypothetical protein